MVLPKLKNNIMAAKFKNLFVLILFINCVCFTNNTVGQTKKPNRRLKW